MIINYNLLKLVVIFFMTEFCLGCKKLVEVNPPPTSVTGLNAYNSDATAAAVLTGLYSQLSGASYTSQQELPAFSFLGGLSADELTLYNGVSNASQIAYYTNALSINTGGFEIWISTYANIYICNSAIEGLNNSNSLTPSLKQQLIGEAKFVRAFCYFYLMNLFGDAPLVIGTNYIVNERLPRASRTVVYQQIIADLKDAQTLLTTGYVDGSAINSTTERVRPNSWAATALLSRTYLYTDSFANAATQATSVISHSILYGLDTLKGVFLANSSEAIWQLQPVAQYPTNTQDAALFILPTTGPNLYSWPTYISTNLLNSFEIGDQRKTSWLDSVIVGGIAYYFPYKYKVGGNNTEPVSEYSMVLRLAEQYLIRAEAEANGAGNGLTAAINDLNVIRTRANLPSLSPTLSQNSVLAAIQHERQVELFTEWGHRWLDLKRTGAVDTIMGTPGNACQQKGGAWNTNQQLYPLPNIDVQSDHNLTQNPGYN